MRNTRLTVPSLDHLVRLSDDTGIIQHATETLPNRSTGYCTDDVARAYMVALMYLRVHPKDAVALRLANIYLAFLHDAQVEGDGRFHNFMDYDRTWLDEVGTHDSCGRAMWSLGFGMRFAPDHASRRVCRLLFDRALACIDWLEYSRSQAYAMVGLAHAAAADPEPKYRAAIRMLADASVARYESMRADDWEWFEDILTYDNGRLSEALLRAALALNEPKYGEIGLRTLQFYAIITIENGIFVPIGHEGWYPRQGRRARFAQQPLEAYSMIDAALIAAEYSGDESYRKWADIAYGWFKGKNTGNAVMEKDGGCFDGLSAEGVNRNMGAESTLAYLAGALEMAERQTSALRIAR